MSKLPIHRAVKPKIQDKTSRGLASLPQVEIIRPWQGYLVGAVIRPPGALRHVLLQQKYIKLVDPVKKESAKKVAKKVAKKAPVIDKESPAVDKETHAEDSTAEQADD